MNSDLRDQGCKTSDIPLKCDSTYLGSKVLKQNVGTCQEMIVAKSHENNDATKLKQNYREDPWKNLNVVPVSESSPAAADVLLLNLLADGITWRLLQFFVTSLVLLNNEGSSLVSRWSVSSGSPLDTPDVLPSSAGLPDVESRNLSSISMERTPSATPSPWGSPLCLSCSSLGEI